jgi:hypothetical protein
VQLRQSLNLAIEHLTAAQVPSPRLNAELLIMYTLDCDRAYLYAHPERELTPDETHRYEEALARRATGVPAQYITGHQEFWGLDLIVSPAVLIPRPETEHVVEAALDCVAKDCVALDRVARTLLSAALDLRIVDVGTGSGAIALALAKELPTAKIHATDILPKRSKSPGPMPRATTSLRASSFTAPICWRDSRPPRSTSLFRILPTSANPKKIQCSSKSASSSPEMPSSPDQPAWKSSNALSRKRTPYSGPAAGWYSRSAGQSPIECATCCRDGTKQRSGTIYKESKG